MLGDSSKYVLVIFRGTSCDLVSKLQWRAVLCKFAMGSSDLGHVGYTHNTSPEQKD